MDLVAEWEAVSANRDCEFETVSPDHLLLFVGIDSFAEQLVKSPLFVWIAILRPQSRRKNPGRNHFLPGFSLKEATTNHFLPHIPKAV